MSDKTVQAIKAYLTGKDRKQAPQVLSMHEISHIKGLRAKRTIDMKRTNQDYYRMKTIQQPLLDHYENVDWWERDTDFDLPYVQM